MIWIAFLFFATQGFAQNTAPPTVSYHLTSRPWLPLNTPRELYLDQVEGIVRGIAPYQDASGAIIDPYAKKEIQYATPYFAYAVGTLVSAGRATDLLPQGIAAVENATAKVNKGSGSIPDNHGEFFLAPLAKAVPLYAAHVSPAQLKTWQQRMAKPVEAIIRGRTHNWRTYAMKGEWYRAMQGFVKKDKALKWVETSWLKTQKPRFTNNKQFFYHDETSDPDTWAYEAAARGNLLNMLSDSYDGASRADMLEVLQQASGNSLLLQDPSGQAAAGGRSGNHTWNDIVLANGYETLAELYYQQGNLVLAGQYRRAAALGFESALRWRRPDGTFSVTKNHYDPAERNRYAAYSFLTNYNGYMMYHLSENYQRHLSAIPEQPAPNEIGGYTLLTDSTLATAVANAGGMQMQVTLRGASKLVYGLYWSTLGVVRFGKTGWDTRLGPSDGVRETATRLGVSFAPTFREGSDWVRLASMPDRYEAIFSTQFTHPLLVRCRVEYRPKPGKTGPTFSNDFIITPDGIRSTLTSSIPDFGVTWPLLTHDGQTKLQADIHPYSASTSFTSVGDEQNFIALHDSPTITATDGLRRSSYGDLLPVRMVSNTPTNVTFIYPRSPGDPTADSVRASYMETPNGFATALGSIENNLYIGRTSAGGVGKSLDIDKDGKDDVTFSATCGFVLQLENGRITHVETDRAVTASIYGTVMDLQAYTPASVNHTTPPPTAPLLKATVESHRVQLSWSATGSSYTVLAAEGEGNWKTIAEGVTATSYTDTTVQNGTAYCYQVIATNISAKTATSNTACATPLDAPVSWRYGGAGEEGFTSMLRTNDGGYLFGGHSKSGATGDRTQANKGGYDFWVVKTDAAGEKQWDASYGGSSDDYLNRVLQTKDGGYLLAGSSKSGISGDKTEESRGSQDFWIVKISATGEKEWDKTYGGSAFDDLRKAGEFSTGEFLLAGVSDSGVGGDKTENSQGGRDMWVLKVSQTGVKIWDRRYGGSGNDYLESFMSNSGGSFLLAGSTFSDAGADVTQPSKGIRDFWVVSIDEEGNKLWDKRYGGTGQEELYSMGRTRTGEFYLAGHSNSGISGDKTEESRGGTDFWMLKISNKGEVLWDKTYGGNREEELRSILQTRDGGYLLAGKSSSGISGDKTEDAWGKSDYWVVKTNARGEKQWDRRYGGSGEEELRYLLQVGRDDYLLGGRSASGLSGNKSQNSQGGEDYWIVKVEAADFQIDNQPVQLTAAKAQDLRAAAAEANLQATPNPFAGEVTVRFKMQQEQPVKLQVYDPLGKLVATLYDGKAPTEAVREVKWQPNARLASGIYTLRLSTPDMVSYQKILYRP